MQSTFIRQLFLCSLFAGAWFTPASAHTAPKPARSHVIRPCVPGEPAHTAALAEIEAIDGAIKALQPAALPSALLERLAKLASSKCFEIGGNFYVAAKTGLSLRTYWENGGSSNFRAPLGLGGRGERWVFSAPSARRAFTLETDPKSPLAHLLCPAADETCGAETAGWARRADAAFAAAGELEHLRYDWRRGGGSGRGDGDVCDRLARAAPVRRRFELWRDCMLARAYSQTALPIGHFRAPKDGWLVIEGRRGHYDFCDETRAYDLTHGSAYIVGSCSALALRSGGSVDVRKTDDNRQLVVKLGRLPVETLREAAWMILLMDEVDQQVRLHSMGLQVPEWIEVMRVRDDDEGGVTGGVAGGSTAQTTLRWRATRSSGLVKSGKLTFPYDFDPAENHAVQLLQIAEAAFAESCPQRAPPLALLDRPVSLSANRIDADERSLALASKTLAAAWRQALNRQQACAR